MSKQIPPTRDKSKSTKGGPKEASGSGGNKDKRDNKRSGRASKHNNKKQRHDEIPTPTSISPTSTSTPSPTPSPVATTSALPPQPSLKQPTVISTLSTSVISSSAVPPGPQSTLQTSPSSDLISGSISTGGSSLLNPPGSLTSNSAAARRSAQTETGGFTSMIGGQKVIIPPLKIVANKIASVTLKKGIASVASAGARPVGKVAHGPQPPSHKTSGKVLSNMSAIFRRSSTSAVASTLQSNQSSSGRHSGGPSAASSTSTLSTTGPSATLTSTSAPESPTDDYRLLLSPMFAAMTKITDNLFLTGVGGMTRNNFSRNHIDFVVNITTDAPFWEDVESLRIALEDDTTTNMLPYLDFAVDKIHEVITLRNAHVLVHCVAGVSRSATVVIAYLMKYRRMDLRTAFNHCYHLRPVIRPNNGFMTQLMNYEMQLFGRSSAHMIQANFEGTVVTIPNFFMEEHPRLTMLEVLRVRDSQRQAPTHQQPPLPPSPAR